MLFHVLFTVVLVHPKLALNQYQQYFFQQFGYIDTLDETPDALQLKQLSEVKGRDAFDIGADIPDMIVSNDIIKKMQLYADIEQTGVIDNATIRMMKTPRCQNPDIVGDPNNHLSTYYLHDPAAVLERKKRGIPEFVRQKRFVKNRKWEKLELSVGFENTTPQNARTKEIIMSAFDAWAECSNLSFELKEMQQTDIRIRFAGGEHAPPEGDKFDGRGGVLAHAWYPPTGLAHFDEDEDWVDDCYLYSVALHEIGHLLGLDHSSSKASIMFAYFSADDTLCDEVNKRLLNHRDIENIRQKYGMKSCTLVEDWSEGPGDIQDITTTAEVTSKPTTTTMSVSGSFFNPYRTTENPYNTKWEIKCGEIEDNVLSSPNYPFIYPNAVNCSWNISAPSTMHTIEIHLFEFQIEEPKEGECIFDYLLLKYNEASKTQKLCGRQSGAIKLDTDFVELQFVTDSLKQYKGFKILFTFEAPPPCKIIYDKPSGVIHYPSTDINASSKGCTLIIKGDRPHKKLFIVIEKLKITGDDCLEDQFVLLDIIDDEEINLITDLCSHEYKYDYFISDYNNVTITTKPGQNNTMVFRIRYYSIEDSRCSTTLYDEGVWTTPQNLSNKKYTPNTDCIIYLANTETEPLYIDFGTINIEYDKNCSYDFVEVYSDENGRQRYCGEDIALSTIPFQSNALIYFHTDGSVESQGFTLQFYKFECNEDINNLRGRIVSPKDSDGYLEGASCEYKFRKDRDYFICFTGQFEIQGMKHGIYQDYFELTTVYETERTSYQFAEKPPPFVLTKGSYLRFESNRDGHVGAGFTFEYLALSHYQSQCYRYLTMKDFNKNLQYYSYRDYYQTCVWQIEASNGYGIEVEFKKIKLKDSNCKEEYIRIYKGDCDDYVHKCKHTIKKNNMKTKVMKRNASILFNLRHKGSFFNLKLKRVKIHTKLNHRLHLG